MHIEAMRRIKNKLCSNARKGVDPAAYCGLSCNHCFWVNGVDPAGQSIMSVLLQHCTRTRNALTRFAAGRKT